MKTAIVYTSFHHGNTKKLLDAIGEKFPVTLINAKDKNINLSEYDTVGFASGIYYFRFHEDVIKAAELLPEGTPSFLIYTFGARLPHYERDIRAALAKRKSIVTGSYSCRGLDTYKLMGKIGGIAKNHPDKKDISGAVNFFKSEILK